jgi:hypothetical protein
MTAHGLRRVLPVVLAAAAFVGVALAATGGPVPLAIERSGGWTVQLPEQPRDGDLPESAEHRLQAPEDQAADVASILVQVVAIIAVAVVVILIGRRVARALAALPPGEPIDFASAEVAPPSGPPAALSEAVDDGLVALTSGPVDEVIIACWVRLEDAAAAGGVTRLPSETPTELAVRVLARFDVPAEPVERLLSLYRAARYSRHRLDEDDRAAAIAALQEIGAAMAVLA